MRVLSCGVHAVDHTELDAQVPAARARGPLRRRLNDDSSSSGRRRPIPTQDVRLRRNRLHGRHRVPEPTRASCLFVRA